MFGPLGSGAIGANNLDIRELSSAELNLSASVAYNSIITYDSQSGDLGLSATGSYDASLAQYSIGELQLQSNTAVIFIPSGYTNIDVIVNSNGELVISGTHVFSQGYISSSQGELQIEAVSVISAVYPRTSLGALEIAATTDVSVSTLATIYTATSDGALEIAGTTGTELAVVYSSQGNLDLSVSEQAGKTEEHARGGSRTLKKSQTREHAYISHVRLSMRIETADAGYTPAPEPKVAESKTPRPLGEFEKFLQNFGHRSVDYSFDSSTGTVSFWVRSETETSNPRTERATAEQIDDEDALLLGISENGLVLDSSYTSTLRESHLRRHSIEQDDLRMLGLGELG